MRFRFTAKIFLIVSFIFICLNSCKQDVEQKANPQLKQMPAENKIVKYSFTDGKINDIKTIEELDRAAAFSFAIMSDNKGDGPDAKPEFRKMVEWIKEGQDKFVIGLGDHLKKGWKNDFLDFLKNDKFWFNNFYANVADGENEYYGKSQGDWGSGAPILEVNKLSEKKHVKIRENKCEYYARIKVGEYTVHLIQLHYSDSPSDVKIAFNADSKKYLVETLEKIEKGDKDIVIVAAHSRTGFFFEQLDSDQRKIVYEKCDLVLSATTHFFSRLKIKEYGDDGPLYVNTGSITYAAGHCPFGYIQVHVLENPFSLVVQYYDAKKETRQFQHPYYAWIKKINGKILATNFRKPTKKEDMERLISTLSRDYSKAEMDKLAKEIYLQHTKADVAYIGTSSGIEKGEVRYKHLYKVFKYNNEIFALTLTKKQIQEVFKDTIKIDDKNELLIAINSYEGEWIIKHFELADDKILKTGVKEVDELEKWVKEQK